jgi:hypothetical protein
MMPREEGCAPRLDVRCAGDRLGREVGWGIDIGGLQIIIAEVGALIR